MKIEDHTIQTLMLKDGETIPNNPRLPVILYQGALEHSPEDTEAVFNKNGWLNSWRNGVFHYHHFHSNAHEALGVIRGVARLQLGGEHGEEISVRAGDCLVLPAGTGHRRLRSSPDFLIAGAYPNGASYNTRIGKPEERAEALQEIRAVPIPNTDPVFGAEGPLLQLWK
ncbi:hypothetical protein DCC85_21005 [Paenibacillus sp. CAA11]|nr:hypothetical protein DCC85_21005 [Paenibacillus sp. CAA11]